MVATGGTILSKHDGDPRYFMAAQAWGKIGKQKKISRDRALCNGDTGGLNYLVGLGIVEEVIVQTTEYRIVEPCPVMYDKRYEELEKRVRRFGWAFRGEPEPIGWEKE